MGNERIGVQLTHEIGNGLAHGGSKNEVLQQIRDESERHAEDGHHEITDSQREQEGVCDRAHALVHHQYHDDQQVAKHTQEEDQRVEKDPHRVHF